MVDSQDRWNSVGIELIIETPQVLLFRNPEAVVATASVFLWKPFTRRGFARLEMLCSVFRVLLRAMSDRLAALLNVEMHLDHIELGIRCDGSDMKRELEIVVHLIQHISSLDVMTKCVPAMLADLAERCRNDSVGGLVQLREALFKEHPYSVWAAHAHTLARSMDERAIVRELHLALFQVRCSCVVIVPPGVFDGLDTAATRLSELLAFPVEPGEIYVDGHAEGTFDPQVIQTFSDTELAVGARTFGLADNTRVLHGILAASMLSRSGRLHTVLRDQHALVYAVSSLVQQGIHGGMVGAYVRARASIRNRVLEMTLLETRQLFLNGIDRAELEKCKRILLLALAESLSAPRSLIRRIAICHRLERAWTFETEQEEIHAVAIHGVRKALAGLGPDQTVALGGDRGSSR